MMGLLVVFNFLRTSTVALTAQAAGRGDEAGAGRNPGPGPGLALLIGALLLLVDAAGDPGRAGLLHARGGVAGRGARTYVGIRYWGGARGCSTRS